MRRTAKCGLLLLAPVLLTGCAKSFAAIVASDELCRDWRTVTVSKHDKLTEETASQIEASNKSRPAWGCKREGAAS